jgi:hypothetical protein
MPKAILYTKREQVKLEKRFRKFKVIGAINRWALTKVASSACSSSKTLKRLKTKAELSISFLMSRKRLLVVIVVELMTIYSSLVGQRLLHRPLSLRNKLANQ